MTTRRIPCEHRWDPAVLGYIGASSFADIDAFMERNGRFMFIEHKPAGFEWDARSEGQRLALARLARLPGCTVLCLREHPDGFEVRDMGVANDRWRPVTLDRLRSVIGRWYDGTRAAACADHGP